MKHEGLNMQGWFFQSEFNLSLKQFREGAIITFSGREFQESITRSLNRVAMVREKCMENLKKIPGQGKILGILVSVREIKKKWEKSGKSQGISEFSKIVIVLQSSEKFNFYKLQMVFGLKCYFHNNLGLGPYFINKSCKTLIFVLSIWILGGWEWL